MNDEYGYSEGGEAVDRRAGERRAAAPVDKLLTIIAYAYQVAGAHDVPDHILDVLADPEEATAEQIDAMLPYVPAAPVVAVVAADLHRDIMNLPCKNEPNVVMPSYWYKRGHKDARHAAAELVNAALASQAQAAPSAPTDHDEAVLLLAAVFDAWENGDPCHEDGDTSNTYLGTAFQLDDDIFHRCCNLLNRKNPPRNAGLAAQAAVGVASQQEQQPQPSCMPPFAAPASLVDANDSGTFKIALNVRHKLCHQAAGAFWKYWNENGETHKRGYYESTWGAINQALKLVGVIPHTYEKPEQSNTAGSAKGGITNNSGAASPDLASIASQAQGIEFVADWLDKKRIKYDSENASQEPDTGAWVFRSRDHEDYSNALAELVDEIRGLAAPIEYTPGRWFDARTLDEMQAFYLSRLPAIRAAAEAHGYAIGLHGSMRRDFDLMAMQWRDDAADKDTLAHAIAYAACGISRDGAYQWEAKPSGRFAVSIPICWTDHGNPEFGDKLSLGHIDLSVIASTTPTES